MTKDKINEILGNTALPLPGASISIDEGVGKMLDMIDAGAHATKELKMEKRKKFLKSVEKNVPEVILGKTYEAPAEIKLVKLPRDGTVASRVYAIVENGYSTKSRKLLLKMVNAEIGGTKNNSNVHLGSEIKRYLAIKAQTKKRELPRVGSVAAKVYHVVEEYYKTEDRKTMMEMVNCLIGGTMQNSNVHLGFEIKRYLERNEQG